jgi:hypothetical protein
MTPVVAVHGALPDSKPGLPSFWPGLEQPPAPLTVSEKDVVWVALVPVPVIVTGKVPAGVVVAVVIVMVDEPPAVTDDGLNDAVAPDGRPLADSETVCAEPEVTAVDTVADTEPPGFTAPDVGDTEMEKSLPAGAQVGSPVWTGTDTAFQAALVAAHSAELAPNRLTAALREASRTLA